jgi:hypothetical protein
MRITHKKIDIFKTMVQDGGNSYRSPDLFEAAFLDNGFSKTNMLKLLGWKREVYEKRRKKLQDHITVKHLKKISRLLDMPVKDVFELVEKNAPLNGMKKKEVEVILASSLYKPQKIKWDGNED